MDVLPSRASVAPAVARRSEEWFQEKELEGKTLLLWELEVWLRALDRFFRIKNLPLSQPNLNAVLEKNFIDELLIAGEGMARAKELAHQVLGEERVNLLKFNRYVEESLLRDDERGSYLRSSAIPETPEWRLNALIENLAALLQVQGHLARLGTLSYFGYKAFGRLLSQSLGSADLFGPLQSNPFRPRVDRVGNARVVGIVKGIADPYIRGEVARLVAQQFRFLHYLDVVRNEFVREGVGKRNLLLFTLINAEMDVSLRFLKDVVLKKVERRSPAHEILDAFAFGMSMDMKKVFQKELLDFAALTEREAIYIRMEDAHGIVKESLQQGVVAVMQFFDPAVEGKDIFPNFVTKREHSLKLLQELRGLHHMVAGLEEEADFEALFKVIRRIDIFQKSSLRLLMYKDWNDFETFLVEFKSCKNLKNFQFVIHRFETYLATLLEEVRKRSVLRAEDIAQVLGEPEAGPKG